MKKIGVIGCGNMASQIVKGIHKAFPDLSFFTYTPSQTKAIELAKSIQGTSIKELSELSECDLLLIGCKPQQWQELASKMNSSGLNQQLCVSMLAATSFEALQGNLPNCRFIRIMPNTPIGLGLGITLFLKDINVSDDESSKVLTLFEACSEVHVMKDEKMLDQVTTVSGCGPAYVYLFAKFLSDSLRGFGMEDDEARSLVVKLFQGSSELMNQASDESFDQLIDKVTSKGGVTIEAVNVFKNKGFEDMTKSALSAAYERSVQLTKETN